MIAANAVHMPAACISGETANHYEAEVAKAIVQVEFNRPKADAAGDADDEDLVELDTASEEEV